MNSVLVHDLGGRPIGYIDGDRLRDDNGKPVGVRTGSDADARKLSAKAGAWMTDRPVLMDLAVGDVTSGGTVGAYSIPDTDFVANKVCPVRMVKHDRGTFYPEKASDAISPVLPVAGANGARAAELGPGFAPVNFITTGYALATRIPRPLGSNADFDLRAIATHRLVEALKLAREIRVAALLTTSANWAVANRITATAKWNGGATANPLLDMMNALQQSYLPANIMILPENVAQNFYVQPQASTGIRDYVQGGGEMPERLYARAKKFVGGVPTYIWAPAAAVNVAIVRTSPDPLSLTTAVTFRWVGEGEDGAIQDGVLIREFYDPSTDSDWIVCAHNDLETFLSNQVGAVITGAQA